MKRYVGLAVCLIFGLLFAGCATPAYRISKNQELFDSFSSEVQARVREGKVDIGYTRDMVLLALGRADREYTRRTQSGITDIWSYTDTYVTSDRQRVEGTFRLRDAGGRYRSVSDTIWVDVDKEHEYEVKRIEFHNGVVQAIEEVRR